MDNCKKCLVLLSPLNTKKYKNLLPSNTISQLEDHKNIEIKTDINKIQINGKRSYFESSDTDPVKKKLKADETNICDKDAKVMVTKIDFTDKENICNSNHNLQYEVKDYADDVISTCNLTKKKRPAEELEAEYQKQLTNLRKHVKLTSKYTNYLQQKLKTCTPSPDNNNGGYNAIFSNLRYFKGQLRDYQIEGVTWLKVLFENCVNGILADEMGLGKTVQIIALICYLYEQSIQGPYLIIAPLSTLDNWYSEFKRFAPEIPVVYLYGNSTQREIIISRIKQGFIFNGEIVRPVIICSFHLPLSEPDFMRYYKWQYIIIDEGHRIKNYKCRLAETLRNLRAKNRTILTGTPLQNDIGELWALFGFLMPQIFKKTTDISSILDLENIKDKEKLLETEAKDNVISRIHQLVTPFMLRREKKFALTDIVPKKEIIIDCYLTPFQNYLYRAVLQKDINKLRLSTLHNLDKTTRSVRKRLQNQNDLKEISSYDLNNKSFKPKGKVPFDCLDCNYISSVNFCNNMVMLREITNHPYLVWTPLKPGSQRDLFVTEDLIKQSGKLLVLDHLLPKLKSGGHKVLIFSTLVMFLDLIEEMLIIRNHKYSRLDGSCSVKKRSSEITKFMTDPETFIFLLSTRAGGLGLNLTAADTVIIMDPDWNPMADLQAKDRCHRIGQTKPVVFINLIAKGTVDQIVVNRGTIKKRLEKIIIQSGRYKGLITRLDTIQLQELEDLLNQEEQKILVRADGLLYTHSEINKILDRSDLYKELEDKK